MEAKPFDQIWLLPDTMKTIKEYMSTENNKKFKDIADKTKSFLRGYYSAYSLELLATVDFILNEEEHLYNWKSMDDNDVLDVVNDAIQNWSKRKSDLFKSSEYLPKIIDHLRNYL